MLKRMGLLTIFAISIAGFVGAQASGDPWSDYVKSQYGGTTITIAATGHTSTDAIRAMEKDFTNATGIKVRWDVMEEGLLRQKLLMEHQSKTGTYDVLMIDAFNLAEYSPSGVAVSLKPFLDNKS